MADDKQRVDWSALMDAHGIEPDADTASPAVEPDRRAGVEATGGTRPRRLVHVVVAITALFSIAASIAVLIVILRGGGDPEEESAGSDEALLAAASARPAAFEQTSDGVAVVPAEAPPPEAEAKPPAPVARAEASPVEKPEATKAREREAKAAEDANQKVEKVEEGPVPEDLPDEPDQSGVTAAMATLQKDIEVCASKSSVTGEVGIKMRIEPDGSVAWASAKLQNSPFQSCLDRLFKKARMPRSAKGATVRQSVQLP